MQYSLWFIKSVHLQDPFPDVRQAFKKPLDKEDIKKLEIELGPYDMDQFLEFFYEFIVTHVKNRNEIEADIW